MKSIVWLSLFFSSLASAAAPVGPRLELFQLGDSLLAQEKSPSQALEEISRLEEQQNFSEEEWSYLADVSRKLPPQDQKKLCPYSGHENCPSSFAKVLPPHPVDQVVPSVSLPAEVEIPSWWQRNREWALPVLAGLAVGAAWSLRNWKFVIEKPSGNR